MDFSRAMIHAVVQALNIISVQEHLLQSMQLNVTHLCDAQRLNLKWSYVQWKQQKMHLSHCAVLSPLSS